MAETLLIKLAAVFAVIVVFLLFHKPLNLACLGGLVVFALLFKVPAAECFRLAWKALSTWSSLSVVVSLFLILFLQQIMSRRHLIEQAQEDLNNLFHNRRVTVIGAPMFIGLLPSAGALILAGDIVKRNTDGYLDAEDQAYITTWIRHVPESIMPTYPCVLLLAEIAGVPLGTFLPFMLIPSVVLVLLGYFPFLRKIPREPVSTANVSRGEAALGLIKHLWPLLLTIGLIIAFNMDTALSLLISIVIGLAVYRFSWTEIKDIARQSLDVKLMLNTYLVLVLKEFIAYSGVLQVLPDVLSNLPIPTYLVFTLMFMIGSFISGSTGMVAMGAPLAFAALQGTAALPLMILLNCVNHAVTQLAPTHICIVIAADYFKVELWAVIKKSIPRAVVFMLFAIGYYQVLSGLV